MRKSVASRIRPKLMTQCSPPSKLVTNIIQDEMDKHFPKQTNELNQMLENETDRFIQAWSSIVEEAVLDAGQIKDPRERR